MIKVCSNCEDEFDTNSPAKRRVGGKINFCCECSEETAVKYVGVQAADGKQTQATILKFESDSDAKRYLSFWQNNSGLHKSYGGQLGKSLSTDPGIRFKTVVAHKPLNHKGRS